MTSDNQQWNTVDLNEHQWYWFNLLDYSWIKTSTQWNIPPLYIIQLCKIHFASAKKASVQPYIFFLIFCDAKRKDGAWLTNFLTLLHSCYPRKMGQFMVYLLKCAKIHRVKNVLCIIWMLFKRDRFLEGFGL